MDLKETGLLGDAIVNHWYYVSKAEAMMRFLGENTPTTLLDIGAGSGFFSRYILERTAAQSSWCIDISYEYDTDNNDSGKQIHFRRSVGNLSADLVLFMDVLEHVDDDIGLLREYAQKVPRGSRFFISVPAFSFLWSKHDDFLEHKRRYTLNQLQRVISSAGLQSQKASYFYAAVFPLAASIRLVQKFSPQKDLPARSQLQQHHPMVNALLKTICRAELPFCMLNKLAGLSVFCLAENR